MGGWEGGEGGREEREGGREEGRVGGKREGGMHVNTSDYAAQSHPGTNLSSFLPPLEKG